MTTTYKEHAVREENANGRTIWKSAPGAAVAFCASADDSLRGSVELHAAAAKAFALNGHDRVWVVAENGAVCDVVTATEAVKVAA